MQSAAGPALLPRTHVRCRPDISLSRTYSMLGGGQWRYVKRVVNVDGKNGE